MAQSEQSKFVGFGNDAGRGNWGASGRVQITEAIGKTVGGGNRMRREVIYARRQIVSS